MIYYLFVELERLPCLLRSLFLLLFVTDLGLVEPLNMLLLLLEVGLT
jgi:hypothetical protein